MAISSVHDPNSPVEDNRRLTSATGLLLTPLLGLVYLTGVAMDELWHVHYFVGFVLIPVTGVKLASTGYRALRYYTGSALYRTEGPPDFSLRLMAPFLVLAVVIALVTGVWLFIDKSRTGALATLHTDSAVIAAGLIGIHFLGYALPALQHTIADLGRYASRWRGVRILVVCLALLAGIAVGVATYSYGTWPARHFQFGDDG